MGNFCPDFPVYRTKLTMLCFSTYGCLQIHIYIYIFIQYTYIHMFMCVLKIHLNANTVYLYFWNLVFLFKIKVFWSTKTGRDMEVFHSTNIITLIINLHSVFHYSSSANISILMHISYLLHMCKSFSGYITRSQIVGQRMCTVKCAGWGQIFLQSGFAHLFSPIRLRGVLTYPLTC